MAEDQAELIDQMRRLGFDPMLIEEMAHYITGTFDPARKVYLQQIATFLEEVLDEGVCRLPTRQPQP